MEAKSVDEELANGRRIAYLDANLGAVGIELKTRGRGDGARIVADHFDRRRT